MPNLAQTVTTPGLQGRIRATMSHAPSFRIDADLPDTLRQRLEALDRVVASRTPEAPPPADGTPPHPR